MNAPIVVRAELVELPKIGDMEVTAETVVCFTAEEGGGHVILSQDVLQALHQRMDNLRERQDYLDQQIASIKRTLIAVCVDTENPIHF